MGVGEINQGKISTRYDHDKLCLSKNTEVKKEDISTEINTNDHAVISDKSTLNAGDLWLTFIEQSNGEQTPENTPIPKNEKTEKPPAEETLEDLWSSYLENNNGGKKIKASQKQGSVPVSLQEEALDTDFSAFSGIINSTPSHTDEAKALLDQYNKIAQELKELEEKEEKEKQEQLEREQLEREIAELEAKVKQQEETKVKKALIDPATKKVLAKQGKSLFSKYGGLFMSIAGAKMGIPQQVLDIATNTLGNFTGTEQPKQQTEKTADQTQTPPPAENKQEVTETKTASPEETPQEVKTDAPEEKNTEEAVSEPEKQVTNLVTNIINGFKGSNPNVAGVLDMAYQGISSIAKNTGTADKVLESLTAKSPTLANIVKTMVMPKLTDKI